MIHRITHWLGWQRGRVVLATGDYRIVWIGFQCATCGRITGIHPCGLSPPPIARFTSD